MHHAPSEKFFSGLESVLFRTLFLSCRVHDEFSCGDTGQSQIFAVINADCGLTDPVNGF